VATGPPKTVLFYNTHLFLDTSFGFLLTSKLVYKDEMRAKAIAARIRESGADIVCLTEVWSDNIKALIAKEVAPTHPHAWWHAARIPVLILGAGIMWVCKGPMTGGRFLEFRRLCGLDRLSQKGVSSVVHDGVTYMCTHIESDGDVKGVQVRQDNITQIVDEIRAIQKERPEGQIFLMGDFNTIERFAGEGQYYQYVFLTEKLGSVGLHDAFRSLYPNTEANPGFTLNTAQNSLLRHFSTAAGNQPLEQPFRVDHVFGTIHTPAGGFGKARILAANVMNDWQVQDPQGANPAMKSLDLSDHYPAQVTFALVSQ
jgi:endonuclease/exonuclease/phosphatase family metal-dependent hydrolase